MAGLNPTFARQVPGRRISSAALKAPRLIMSWEDWLTLVAATITFLSLAVSIQQADWVKNDPAIVPTVIAGLVIGLFAARVRASPLLVQPLALLTGVLIVVLAAQQYAEGTTLNDRLADFRLRFTEWWAVVTAGDISNDNLPFVTLIQGVAFLSAYLASWSIYRWRNAWIAVLPAGFVLLTNISFLRGQPSAAFITYLFGSILLVARLHLQSSQERWKREGVEYPEFVSINTLNYTVLLAAALIVGAWLIPLGTQAKAAEGVLDTLIKPARGQTEHLFRLFHNVDSARGSRLHSFGDILAIQGEVRLSSKVMLEVGSAEGGLIRATSYDEYTGTGWKATDRDRKRVEGGEIAPAEETAGGYQARAVTVLNVRVIARESTILTPGIPLGANLSTYIESPEEFTGDIERMTSRTALDLNDSYNSIGSESRATAEQLRSAAPAYPDWVTARYLQLPDSLPERVIEEAKRVAAGAANPYDRAVAIEQYLRELPYDLSVPAAPPRRDAVDWLLFDLKRGYFDTQASAMAVMLRSLGIPARVAVGYILDPDDVLDTRYTVRKDDSYAWVEVFFPGYGWVNFNPTQDRPAGGAGGLGAFGPDGGGVLVEPEDLSGLFDDTLIGGEGIFDALTEDPVIAGRGGFPWLIVLALTAVVAVLAAAGLGARIAWSWGIRGLEPRAAMWEKVQRLAGWTGHGSRPEETPTEWSRRLGAAVDREGDAARLAAAYEEARYGPPDLVRVDPEETGAAYRSLRNTLANLLIKRRPRR